MEVQERRLVVAQRRVIVSKPVVTVSRMATKTRKACKYTPTKKNRNTLKRYKRGESIGFTQTASLKAKGMLPRTSKKNYGKRIVSDKYCSS